MEALSSEHQYIENATRSLFVENTTLTRNALCWDFSSLKCEESTFCIANLTNYVKHFHLLMSQQSPCKRKSCKSFLPTITMQPCFSFPTSGQWKAFLCILTKCKLSWPKSYLTQKTLWPRSFDHIQSRRIWSILPFFLSSALLCFFSWEVLGSWGLEPAAEVAYFFLPPADSSHRSGILEKALKETDGINTKKEKCSTKNKASPLHTKSDFWKWIKIMKFG